MIRERESKSVWSTKALCKEISSFYETTNEFRHYSLGEISLAPGKTYLGGGITLLNHELA